MTSPMSRALPGCLALAVAVALVSGCEREPAGTDRQQGDLSGLAADLDPLRPDGSVRGVPTKSPAPTPAPTPGATHFKATCVDVAWVTASNKFGFACDVDQYTRHVVTTFGWADGTGKYPVGADEGQTAHLIDNAYASNIGATVLAFIALKKDHPGLVLKISGPFSKLPAANGSPKVDYAHFELD